MDKFKFEKFKIDLMKGKVTVNQLKQLKVEGTKNQFFWFIKFLMYQRNFSDIYFPKELKNLIAIDNIPCLVEVEGEALDSIIMREFSFYVQCFLVYQVEINDFLYLRDCFEKKLILNDFEEACQILKNIHSNYGVSHWLLDAVFVLKSLSNNEIEYVSFYRSLKKNKDKVTIKVIELFKEKNRNSSTESAFREIKTKNLEDIDIGVKKINRNYSAYKFYLESLVQFDCITDIKQTVPLVKSISFLPLIDKFLLFEKIISVVITNQLLPLKKIVSLCKPLNNVFPYSFLSKSSFDLEKIETNLSFQVENVNKLFFNEKYEECLSACLNALNENANCFSLICLAGKCCLILNTDIEKNTVLNKLIYSVKSLFMFDEKRINDIYFNSKLLSLFLNSTIFYDFNYIFEDCNDMKKSNVEYSFWMKNVFSKTYYYSFDEIYNKNIVSENRASNEIQYRNNWGKCFLLANQQENINLGRISRTIKSALLKDIELLNDYYTENIERLSKLNSVDRYCFIEIAKILLDKKEKNLDIIGAITIFNDLYLESMLVVKNIDYRELSAKILESEIEQKCLKSIDYLIFSYIIQMNRVQATSESMKLTKYAINYIKLNGIDVFDVSFIPNGYMEKKKYLFMIYYICNVNWIKHYYLNVNKKVLKPIELYKKRLCLLDIIKKSGYDVDLDELNSEIEKLIYDRDISFIKKNKNSGHVDLGVINLTDVTKSEVLNAFTQIKTQDIMLRSEAEKNSKYYLLMEAFKKYRKDFISKMDVVIGHIRHNKFNNILDLLQKNDLYIRKSENFNYSPKFIDDLVLEEKIISSFSSKVNAKIEFIRSKKLGPYDEKKNEYGIHLFIEHDIIYDAFTKLNLENINNLYDTFYKLLVDQLKMELNRVKKEIVDSLREFFSFEFDDMLKALSRQKKLSENLKKSKLELEDFYKNLEKWLSYSEESTKQNYSIDVFVDDFIQACIKKGLNITYENRKEERRNVNIKDISPYKLNMILENFVSNAIKHSGFESHDLNIIIEFTKLDDKIAFKFSNKISQDISDEEMDNRIKMIQERIDSKERRDEDKNISFGNGYYTVIEILNEVISNGWRLTPNYDRKNGVFSIYLELLIRREEN